MKIDTLLRHFREAYRGISKNSWMSFAAIGAVAVTLLIFGIFMIFAINLGSITEEIGKEVSLRATIKSEVKDADAKALVAKIQAIPHVEKAEFIHKDDAVKKLKKESKEPFMQVLETGEANILPNMIVVAPTDAKYSSQVKADILKNPEFSDVKDGDIAKGLYEFVTIFKNIVLIFGLALAVLASFLISNTIKLTIIARKREIEVMRLVGASNWFIRWPFFIEGGFIGLIGAIVPIGILLVVYQAFYNFANSGKGVNLLQMVSVGEMGLYLSTTIFLIGTFIGVSGSLLSVRRFLKV